MTSEFKQESGKRDASGLLAAFFVGRYLGYSLIVAWFLSIFFNALSFLAGVETILLWHSHLLSSVAHLGFSAVLVLLASRLSPLNHRRDALYLAGAMGTVGSLIICLCSLDVLESQWYFLGFLIVGASAAWIELAWSEIFSVLGVKRAIWMLASTTVLGCLFYLVVRQLSLVPFMVIVTLLPLAGMFLLRPSNSPLLQHPVESKLKTALAALPLRLMCVIGLLFFVYGVSRSFLMLNGAEHDQNGAIEYLNYLLPLVLSSLIAIVLKGRNFRSLLYICIFLLAGGAIVIAYSENAAFLAIFVSGTVVQVLEFLVWFMLIDLTVSRKTTAMFAMAVLYSLRYLGMLLGQVIGEFLWVWGSPIAASLSIMCLLLAATMVGAGAEPLIISLVSPDDRRVGMEKVKLAVAAKHYALSPRESEILTIWCAGRSSAYIQKELGITHNTVKTHIAHIYTKVGVSNREDLMSTIESLKK
jgi:DNA-binding CsgD family transcriptional regulator